MTKTSSPISKTIALLLFSSFISIVFSTEILATGNPSIHRPERATHTALSSGSWSDPATWGGDMPGIRSRIAIPEGITVTIDSELANKYKSIAIDGTLKFANDVNTSLLVDTMTSGRTGTLEIGTETNPIQEDVTAKVTFANLGKIKRRRDPSFLSRGAVLAGKTTMFGAAKTHRITLASFPQAGASTLTFTTAPSGWRAGDEIVITGTQAIDSDEKRTITAINGAEVTLDRALELDHVPPEADLKVWVANLTRNIVFDSESRKIRRRGHIMFHHTNDVSINNAGFYNLGRTDKSRPLNDFSYEFNEDAPGNEGPSPIVFTVIEMRGKNVRGRYGLHVHRAGNDPSSSPAIITGSVVENIPGWGFVNHSSNVHMINNVSYNVQGSGFYTETGDEIGLMDGNIAIRTINPSFKLDDLGAIDPDLGLDRGDFGVDGDGFWLSGNMVSVTNNVSSGSSAHGIIFWTDGLIEPDTGRSTVRVEFLPNGNLVPNRETLPVWWAPLATVKDNESYTAVVGFRSRYIHSDIYMGEAISDFHEAPPQAYIDTLNPVFDGVTVWNSRDGVLLNYNERISLKNARLVGRGDPFQHNLGRTAAIGVGLDLQNEATAGPHTLENISIKGYEAGFLAPRHGNVTVNNMQLANLTDVIVHESKLQLRTMNMTNISFDSLDNTAVAGRSPRRNIFLDLDLDLDDGFDQSILLQDDTLTLNGKEVFFDQQAADFIPFTSEFDDEDAELGNLNPQFIGKTNQELSDSFGVAFAGEILPANAIDDPRIINGKIEP